MVSNDLIYKVAIAYYVDKKKQREIADELNVSRVQVSNYLKMAEQRGLIRVEIIPPAVDDEEQTVCEASLKRIFPLKKLILCPSYNSRKLTLQALFRQTESFVLSSLDTKDLIIGTGWGKTTYEFIEQLGEHERPQWKIVPLAGGSGRISNRYYNVNFMVQRLSDKLSCQSQLLYLPFFFDSSQGKEDLLSNEIKTINGLWNNLDVIICSVGSEVTNSPLFQKEIVGEKYLAKIKNSNCSGDLLTHFFDINGNIIKTGIENRINTASLEQIRKAKTKIVIAIGENKYESILGALRAGLVDVLVTDYATVEYLRKIT